MSKTVKERVFTNFLKGALIPPENSTSHALDRNRGISQSRQFVGVRDKAVFYLNGQRQEVGEEAAGMMLADFLRTKRSLTGTKIVCAEGDCGACSVLRYSPLHAEKKISYLPVNSCIATVAQMDGSSLITVDALAISTETAESTLAPYQAAQLSPIQRGILDSHASQCGFCTPGFVVALTGLVEKKLNFDHTGDLIGVQEAKNAMTGNLCRCTGYQPLIDAACSIDLSRCKPLAEKFYSKEQDRDLKKAIKQSLLIETKNFTFFAPKNLKECSTFLKTNKKSKVVAAATDLGVLHNKRKIRLKELLSLHLIPDLYSIKKKSSRLFVGSRVTLSQLRTATKDVIPELARFIDLFASPQIKNVATLVGNVANASPIAELPPFLLVSDANVHLMGAQKKRTLPLTEFFLDYRKTALKVGEVIVGIDFQIPGPKQKIALYKISERKDLDISAVNAAFKMCWKDEKNGLVDRVFVALGGVAAIPRRFEKVEALFRNQKINTLLIKRAAELLQTEIFPIDDVRGSTAFRRVLVDNLFKKFFREAFAVSLSEVNL